MIRTAKGLNNVSLSSLLGPKQSSVAFRKGLVLKFCKPGDIIQEELVRKNRQKVHEN